MYQMIGELNGNSFGIVPLGGVLAIMSRINNEVEMCVAYRFMDTEFGHLIQ